MRDDKTPDSDRSGKQIVRRVSAMRDYPSARNWNAPVNQKIPAFGERVGDYAGELLVELELYTRGLIDYI